MCTQVNGKFNHWNYFIALEQDLEKLSRYIEFSEANFSTYSIELAHLLLATSSEVDVVMKALCNLKQPKAQHTNINDYKKTISSSFPEFSSEECYMHRFGLKFQPWRSLKHGETPTWWRSYNNVKHQRDACFNEANLKNTLNSVAALRTLLLYYYRDLLSLEYIHGFHDVVMKLRPRSSLIETMNPFDYESVIVS